MEWFKLSTKKDDAKGNYNICYKYKSYKFETNDLSIKGVDEAYKEAVKYCKISAELGYEEAKFTLSLMYENGLGVNKDINEAIKWQKSAYEQHNNEFTKNRINYLENLAKENENKSSDEKQNTKKINTENKNINNQHKKSLEEIPKNIINENKSKSLIIKYDENGNMVR
jgi:TPR repeat protein